MKQNNQAEGYDYSNRQGIFPLSWRDFQMLSRRLAEGLAGHRPQAIVGVARAGLFPAVELAHMLRLDLYPVRITRRVSDRVVSEHPVWKTPVPGDVAGKTVAVVDEIASSGDTLRLVAEAAQAQGAARVVTAALAAHSWANPMPNVVALISDALIIFPWGRHIWQDGAWRPHPEYASALRLQGMDPSVLDRE